MKNIKKQLETIYLDLNKRSYVHPDPLEFLYRYKDPLDVEIVGMIASSLAYGRVAQILKSVSHVLDTMGASPSAYLRKSTHRSMLSEFKGFSHRFAKGDHLAAMLFSVKKIIDHYGSLNSCFAEGISPEDDTILNAMTSFAEKLTGGRYNPGHLIAMPEKKSACKRMNLFLRWMVRKDLVDPGGWTGISPAKLIIPLDTHMHRTGITLGLTGRKQANMLTALEITSGFRKISPEDPVKYDFALTRFGIRDDMNTGDLLFLNKDI